MSHQVRFGHNGTEPTTSTQPDDDDDGVPKKAENVSHAQDPTKRESLGIHATCGIRHRPPPACVGEREIRASIFCGMALVLVFGRGRLDVINEEHVDDSFLPLEF